MEITKSPKVTTPTMSRPRGVYKWYKLWTLASILVKYNIKRLSPNILTQSAGRKTRTATVENTTSNSSYKKLRIPRSTEKLRFLKLLTKHRRVKKITGKKYGCRSVKNNQPTSTMGIFLEKCIIVEN